MEFKEKTFKEKASYLNFLFKTKIYRETHPENEINYLKQEIEGLKEKLKAQDSLLDDLILQVEKEAIKDGYLAK